MISKMFRRSFSGNRKHANTETRNHEDWPAAPTTCAYEERMRDYHPEFIGPGFEFPPMYFVERERHSESSSGREAVSPRSCHSFKNQQDDMRSRPPVRRMSGKLSDVVADAEKHWHWEAEQGAFDGDGVQQAMVSEMKFYGYGTQKNLEVARYWKGKATRKGRKQKGVYCVL